LNTDPAHKLVGIDPHVHWKICATRYLFDNLRSTLGGGTARCWHDGREAVKIDGSMVMRR
jgi:hypothetical protein